MISRVWLTMCRENAPRPVIKFQSRPPALFENGGNGQIGKTTCWCENVSNQEQDETMYQYSYHSDCVIAHVGHRQAWLSIHFQASSCDLCVSTIRVESDELDVLPCWVINICGHCLHLKRFRFLPCCTILFTAILSSPQSTHIDPRWPISRLSLIQDNPPNPHTPIVRTTSQHSPTLAIFPLQPRHRIDIRHAVCIARSSNGSSLDARDILFRTSNHT